MCGFGGGLQFLRPFAELFGLGDKQVRAGIDPDVLELRGLFAQLLRFVQVVGKFARVCFVCFIKRLSRI